MYSLIRQNSFIHENTGGLLSLGSLDKGIDGKLKV